MSATVGVPGGGLYRLMYRLQNSAGPYNQWQATVSSVDQSFKDIPLENIQYSRTFNLTPRELPFTLPDGTAAIRLTFQANQVRSDPQLPNVTCRVHQLKCLV